MRIRALLFFYLFEIYDIGTAVEHAQFFSIVVSHFFSRNLYTRLEMVMFLGLGRVGKNVCVIGVNFLALVLRRSLGFEGKRRTH